MWYGCDITRGCTTTSSVWGFQQLCILWWYHNASHNNFWLIYVLWLYCCMYPCLVHVQLHVIGQQCSFTWDMSKWFLSMYDILYYHSCCSTPAGGWRGERGEERKRRGAGHLYGSTRDKHIVFRWKIWNFGVDDEVLHSWNTCILSWKWTIKLWISFKYFYSCLYFFLLLYLCHIDFMCKIFNCNYCSICYCYERHLK